MEKYIIKHVKSYTDNNLNPVKVNVIDPTKYSLTEPLSIKEILNELRISKDDLLQSFTNIKR